MGWALALAGQRAGDLRLQTADKDSSPCGGQTASRPWAGTAHPVSEGERLGGAHTSTRTGTVLRMEALGHFADAGGRYNEGRPPMAIRPGKTVQQAQSVADRHGIVAGTAGENFDNLRGYGGGRDRLQARD